MLILNDILIISQVIQSEFDFTYLFFIFPAATPQTSSLFGATSQPSTFGTQTTGFPAFGTQNQVYNYYKNKFAVLELYELQDCYIYCRVIHMEFS